MIGKGEWVRTVKSSGQGDDFVPAGLIGQVFWSGFRGKRARLGIDLNGDDARIFVDESACAKFDPSDDGPGKQRSLFADALCQGCEACDGEGGHALHDVHRPACPRCKQGLCPDGCCGCLCGNPIFEKEFARRISKV